MLSRPVVRFVAVLLFATPVVAQTQSGLIRGTVVSSDGNPVQDAHVSAEIMKGSEIITGLAANSDDHGQFVFSSLAMGEYRLSADKAEAGYLSTFGIFSSEPGLIITLTEEAPAATAVIHLGRKAGVITGRVLDSLTGNTVRAKLSLSPMDGSSWSMMGASEKFEFRVLIPADTPMRFGACAEGYMPWFYADPSNPNSPAPVTLSSGAELHTLIKLERRNGKEQTDCAAGSF